MSEHYSDISYLWSFYRCDTLPLFFSEMYNYRAKLLGFSYTGAVD